MHRNQRQPTAALSHATTVFASPRLSDCEVDWSVFLREGHANSTIRTGGRKTNREWPPSNDCANAKFGCQAPPAMVWIFTAVF
jgi:hypothetical protein